MPCQTKARQELLRALPLETLLELKEAFDAERQTRVLIRSIPNTVPAEWQKGKS